MNELRKGRQEPTVWYTLPYSNTKGDEAIELYSHSGRTAQEWQTNLIYDILATNEEGLWTHSRFGYSVPRQNGKNEVISIRELYGLFNGERILHTAHRTMTSRSAWERLVLLLEKSGIKEKRANNPDGYTSGKSRGQEWIKFKDGVIHFRTRSSTGGLGETFDLLVIDEAQEYQDDEESALKYTIVSSSNPQTIYLGTPPTPYSSGNIFPTFRKQVLRGEKKNGGWAEWSVESQTDPHDVEAWYQTNPSLGFTLTERAIEDEIGGDSVDFNIQRLGLWIAYSQKSDISEVDWNKLQVDKLPQLTGKLSIGVKFAKDGSSSALAIAVMTTDNKVFTEVINYKSMRDGIDWIASFINLADYSKVYIDGQSGAELLTTKLRQLRHKLPVIVKTSEFVNANAKFTQMVFDGTLVHMDQPSVKAIVTNCEKRAIQSGFGYKSQTAVNDIAIMDAMILAVYGATEETKPKRKQTISY